MVSAHRGVWGRGWPPAGTWGGGGEHGGLVCGKEQIAVWTEADVCDDWGLGYTQRIC